MNPQVVPHRQRKYGFYCNGFGGNFWLWEVLVLVYYLMRASGDNWMEPRTMRKYGYFYNGFRAGFWWWEVLVQRMEAFCAFLVTYVPIFADAQSKLALFTAICAFFWAVHGAYLP